MMVYVLGLFFLFSSFYGFPQDNTPGPKARALGATQANHVNEDALFANIAGIAEQQHWGLLSNYHLPFGLPELGTIAIGLVVPLNSPIGVGLSQFGGSKFRIQRLSLGLAKKLGMGSIGVRVNHWVVTIPGFDQDHSLSFDLGAQFKLGKHLQFGLLITNINQSEVFVEEGLPKTFLIGSSYSIGKYLTMLLEIGNTLGNSIEGKFGIEYLLYQKMPLRTGFNTANSSVHSGIGFQSRSWMLDYALVLHPVLGYSHEFGLKLIWVQE